MTGPADREPLYLHEWRRGPVRPGQRPADSETLDGRTVAGGPGTAAARSETLDAGTGATGHRARGEALDVDGRPVRPVDSPARPAGHREPLDVDGRPDGRHDRPDDRPRSIGETIAAELADTYRAAWTRGTLTGHGTGPTTGPAGLAAALELPRPLSGGPAPILDPGARELLARVTGRPVRPVLPPTMRDPAEDARAALAARPGGAGGARAAAGGPSSGPFTVSPALAALVGEDRPRAIADAVRAHLVAEADRPAEDNPEDVDAARLDVDEATTGPARLVLHVPDPGEALAVHGRPVHALQDDAGHVWTLTRQDGRATWTRTGARPLVDVDGPTVAGGPAAPTDRKRGPAPTTKDRRQDGAHAYGSTAGCPACPFRGGCTVPACPAVDAWDGIRGAQRARARAQHVDETRQDDAARPCATCGHRRDRHPADGRGCVGCVPAAPCPQYVPAVDVDAPHEPPQEARPARSGLAPLGVPALAALVDASDRSEEVTARALAMLAGEDVDACTCPAPWQASDGTGRPCPAHPRPAGCTCPPGWQAVGQRSAGCGPHAAAQRVELAEEAQQHHARQDAPQDVAQDVDELAEQVRDAGTWTVARYALPAWDGPPLRSEPLHAFTDAAALAGLPDVPVVEDERVPVGRVELIAHTVPVSRAVLIDAGLIEATPEEVAARDVARDTWRALYRRRAARAVVRRARAVRLGRRPLPPARDDDSPRDLED